MTRGSQLKVLRHEDAAAFLRRAGAWLEEREAENHLMLGIAGRLVKDPHTFGPERPFTITIESDEGIEGAALMTPPYRMTLTRATDEALEALADRLFDLQAPVPGVMGPVREAEAFSAFWRGRTGIAVRPGKSLRVHSCWKIPNPACGPGRLRPADSAKIDLVADWAAGFHREAIGSGSPMSKDRLKAWIGEGSLFLWVDSEPVSMAGWQGATKTGVRVSMVYTPPEFRRRGYASSCVAALTRNILESGRRFCFLFTDLANPTSNKIYRSIGYEPVCDTQEWYFGEATES